MWTYILSSGIVLLLYFKLLRFDYWSKRGVPTASGCHWLFGNFKQILFQEKHIKTAAQDMYDEFPEAPVVGYFRLRTPGLLLRDPKAIQAVLISEFSNFASSGYYIDRRFDFLAGYNPFFVKDEEWKGVRAHAAAVVTLAKVRGYLTRIRAVGQDLAKYVAARCRGGSQVLDVKELASMFTTDVLGAAVCGVANNTFEQRDSLFARITNEVSFETSVVSNVKDSLQTAWPALSWLFRLRFSSPKSEEQLLYVTRNVIRERMASGIKRDDLFQVAISMRETDKKGVFTAEYISSLVYTVMLDQYETSSNVIVNTLFALAWHPEIQDRLRKEIIDFKSKNKGEYTVEDVENFKYLDMVMSELLRMCSPVPVLSRECTKDCFIHINKNPLKVEKGTVIIVPIQSIHMDPKYYPEPEKFDPDRFSEEEVAKRPKYTHLPFGAGPKRCLGPQLGALQVKIAVMTVLEQFHLRPAGAPFPPPIVPGIFVISCPAPPTTLVFEPLLNQT